MGAVRLLAGSDIRRRWRGIVALALMVGVVGAVVLATAAGARRSESALSRFNAWSRSSDVELSVGTPSPAQVAAFAHSPGVADVAALNAFALTIGDQSNLAVAAAVDGRFGDVVDRARIIKGRKADPADPNEITIGESLAAQLHVGVGDHLDATSFTPAQFQDLFAGRDAGPPAGPRLHLRIVGIGRRPLDLGDRASAGGVVVLTPAFNREYSGRIALFTEVLRVRTQRGAADVTRVTETARRIFPTDGFEVQGLSIETQGAADAIDVLARALWIFAAVVALAGAVVIGIILAREFSRMSVDQPTLRSLGLSRRQRAAAGAPRAALIAGSGAILAVVGAILASPLFPIGLARRADPDPGLHVDWAALAIGAAAIAVVVLLFALLAVARATRASVLEREPALRRRGPSIVERAAAAGLRPTFSTGLRMAFQPGTGETAVPVRSAFVGAAFGVLGVVAVLVFAASLNHLVDTPRMYGWTFGFRVADSTDYSDAPNTCPRADFGVPSVPGVTDVAAVCYQSVEVNGRPITGWGFTQLRGSIEPEIVAGRAPSAPGEVALGQVTMRALGKAIGDTVQVHGANVTADFTVVGQVVLPGLSTEEVQPLADGAAFTDAGQARIFDDNTLSRFIIGRFASGADEAAVVRRLSAIKFGPDFAGFLTNPPDSRLTVPPEVEHLRKIDWFLPTLAALLAALALLAVGHALVTAVRRRGRELALLRTLGFDRRQVRATVAWQAVTLATIGLVVGIPVGVIVGSYAWRVVADGLGVTTSATIPALAIVLTIPCALVLVNLIGWFAARRAVRSRPAVALASE